MAVELVFFDLKRAQTVGWSITDAIYHLGLQDEWANRTYAHRYNLFSTLTDPDKFGISTVWSYAERDHQEYKGQKLPEETFRLFAKGFTIREQINTIMEELAGGSSDIMISFSMVEPHIKFRHEGQNYDQLMRTFYENFDKKWFANLEDKNFMSQFVPTDETGLPILPSARGKVFRAGYDLNMEVPDKIID